MKVLGIRCTKDRLQWALVEGGRWDDAVVVEYGEHTAPTGGRGDQLEWARKEVGEVTLRLGPESACIRVAEAGQSVAASLGRAEMDGVVQAALAEAGVPTKRLYGATVRSIFAARTADALVAAIEAIPCVASTAKVRREQVIAAVAGLPAK